MLRGPPPASPSVPTALDSKWSFGLHSERQSARPVRIVQTLRTLDELLFLVVALPRGSVDDGAAVYGENRTRRKQEVVPQGEALYG